MAKVHIDASEFPFVQELPKREKSRRMKLLDVLEQLEERTRHKGPVIPQTLAAEILGISRQRVGQLVEAQRIESCLLNGTRFVFLKSFVQFCQEEKRGPGRPLKAVSPLKRGKLLGEALSDAALGEGED